MCDHEEQAIMEDTCCCWRLVHYERSSGPKKGKQSRYSHRRGKKNNPSSFSMITMMDQQDYKPSLGTAFALPDICEMYRNMNNQFLNMEQFGVMMMFGEEIIGPHCWLPPP